MIHEEIKEKIKEAMLARDEVGKKTFRNIVSAFTNEVVANGKKPDEMLSDDEALVVLTRLAKQRKDSIEQFTKGGRADLAKDEQAELEIIEKYLPKMMDGAEVQKLAEAKKAELGIDDPSKAGILMGALMKELKGKADGGVVKEAVDSLF